MRFYPSAAAAQQAGFRACKRCRPDASPGSPQWNERADVVARAMRLIADGVVDREGVPGLAARLGYSARQVERQLLAELGAGPLALARAQRAQTARLLIETSTAADGRRRLRRRVRQHPDVQRHRARGVRAHPDRAAPPGRRGRRAGRRPGALSLRLPFRQPLCPDNLFGHLAATGVPGVEEWRDGAYRRTLRLPHGHGVVALRPEPDHIGCQLALTDLRDLAIAISRCRWMLDLDADPVAVDELLRADPVLAPLVDKSPGRRVPRTVDGAEFAVRAVLGQQVSTAAARTHAARLVAAHGEPVERPGRRPHPSVPGRRRRSPAVDPATLALPGPAGERRSPRWWRPWPRVSSTSASAATGTRRELSLAALPGFGPWTVETIAMRALGDPDAFLPDDLGIRIAARDLGLPATPAALTRHAAAWRPWRAYAVQYLWATGDHAINRLPAESMRERAGRRPAFRRPAIRRMRPPTCEPTPFAAR